MLFWVYIEYNPIFMKVFEKIQRFIQPYEANYFAVFLSIIKFTCWALYALFSVYVIREATKLYSLENIAWLEYLLGEFIAFSTVFFIVTYFLRTADWPTLYHDMDRWIYGKYLGELMNIESTYLEKIGTGRLISVMTTGSKTWIDGLTNTLKEWTKITVATCFILYLFFSANYLYAGIFIVAFIILHVLVVYADSHAHKHRKIRTEARTEWTRRLVRILMSRNEILQSGTASREIEGVMDSIEDARRSNNKINQALFIIFNLVRLTATTAKIAILLFIIYQWIESNLSPADVAALLSLFIIFEGFLIDSVEFYKNFTKDFSDIEKLWEIFDKVPKNTRYNNGEDFSLKNGQFTFENVSFSYGAEDAEVFEDFSLTLPWKKKIALVGQSGSGKTTLIKMLAGYITPTKWTILIDGVDFSRFSLKSYYPHVGYLSQEPGIFDASIRENLLSALPLQKQSEKLDEQLQRALQLAHCDFVYDLEKGIDTEIGERGVRLSWGQKQRLAIAKIFLKNPEIIFLDEPTSALDSFSEELITAALDTLFEWRTVIIVAHRLQTVKKADEIIVLESGRVIERWNHESLVQENGIYAKMLELQSGF